ncbi:MAG: hypothetical protein AUK32_07720 [Candidatus Aquicultor secundus]|uniref:SurA N-terminal domain-containing protein n=1 Tax=Candidatus Aquicultor secundus TaxID=1973895 RepID=UPI00090F1D37|nr:SurA N-terminal domain-containing protein [Candidatus Aquicultor secundus]OIO85220.1 MAG: hypothetical protein AUK32_07720 [Candidatus Aquicultor secundus]
MTRYIEGFSIARGLFPWHIATFTCVVLILFGVVLIGCQSASNKESGSGKKVAVIVNGKNIYRDEVNKRIDTAKKLYPESFKGEKSATNSGQIENRIVDSLITEKLLIEEAKRRGAKIDESDIEKKASAMFDVIPPQIRQQQKLTKDSLKDTLRNLMVTNFIQKQLASDIRVSEDETKVYYAKNKNQFPKESLAQARGKIKQVLESFKSYQATQQLIEELKNHAKIQKSK